MSVRDLLIQDLSGELLQAEDERDKAVSMSLAYRESMQILMELYAIALSERDALRYRLHQTMGIEDWTDDYGEIRES